MSAAGKSARQPLIIDSTMHTFDTDFQNVTGHPPFPWQTTLYQRFLAGEFPASANIPTGLGKTSVVAVWLLALANAPAVVPRRLVYVVNRRTVVDQTTAEAERLRKALAKPELTPVRNALSDLCALPLPSPATPPLAISTLRGQFADNGEWRADPARPAIIVGTVDMIGSGLLFNRYTAGFKTRPLHAGFLAQDTLLVHDEAHLESAFQTLLSEIESEQKRCGDFRLMRVLELTATSRSVNEDIKPFGLNENPDDLDTANDIVTKRVSAIKRLSFVPLGAAEKLDEKIVEISRQAAKNTHESRAILVFVRTVENALKIAEALDKNETKGKVATLTGTVRGQERDDLVHKPVFQRFLPTKERNHDILSATGTVFLVATSAGEVGVNISADDCVCDLSTYESMAQRFGRINRFGDRDDSTITIVHETEFGKRDKKTKELQQNALDLSRERTLVLLKKLPQDTYHIDAYSASPAALAILPADECAAAFSPPPALRIATQVQFDAWALTSIRESIAARPPVAPYLHGETDEWQLPETFLAWRNDFDFDPAIVPEEFLDVFPLRPCELLRDTTKRIVATLKKLLKDKNEPVVTWLIASDGSTESFKLSADDQKLEDKLAESTLILPTSLGGLLNGLFSAAKGNAATDVSGIKRRESETREKADFTLDISHNEDEPHYQLWFAAKSTPVAAIHGGTVAVSLAEHAAAVTANAAALAEKLLPPDLRPALIAAAQHHDDGKDDAFWQRNIGNSDYPNIVLAKSNANARTTSECVRHEFGSLISSSEVGVYADCAALAAHLIAAHHGRARPHFAADEHDNETLATAIPRAFAALQSKYGRWGLAYLESLLRAADYAASAGIIATSTNTTAATVTSAQVPACPATMAEPSASLALDPLNPGHYFACCGLFELASRLAPEVLAWFEQKDGQWYFHLAHTPPLADLLSQITAAEITRLTLDDADPPLSLGDPFNVRLDWWKNTNRNTSSLQAWKCDPRTCAYVISRSMQTTVNPEDGENLFFSTRVAYDMTDSAKKVEPFYFDANRAPNSVARDVGFSCNDLKLKTPAAPAVELLTLIGLQRAIPRPSGIRLFDCHLWTEPLPISLIPAAVNGLLPDSRKHAYRFESLKRSDYLKAFLPANPIGGAP